MKIYPAIDLYEGKAVRLYRGDYNQMTVYSETPELLVEDFKKSGAEYLHVIDLQGAKDGTTPNIEIIQRIASYGLFVEVGGGIRQMETIDKYISSGVSRVILGTAAVKDENFLKKALEKYGTKVAVGIDIKDGKVAINGWLEKSEIEAFDFFEKMQQIGVQTVICTDISKDGAMRGTNLKLYRYLQDRFSLDIIASGGISSMEDIRELKKMDIYGAIIGKAYYAKAINLEIAIQEAK